MIPWDQWSEQGKIGPRLRARTRAHSDQSCALLCDGAGELALLTPIMSVRSLPASHWLLVQVDSQTVLAAMAMRVSARAVAVAIALMPSLAHVDGHGDAWVTSTQGCIV